MRGLLAAFSMGLALSIVPALSWVIVMPGAGLTGCPFVASAGVDGCQAALASGGQNINPTFFTDIRVSGQTYVNSHPPQWNVPGVDYAVGMETALGSKRDPAIGGNLPTGCTYFAPSASVQFSASLVGAIAWQISSDGGATKTYPGVVICNTYTSIANGISTGVSLPGSNGAITLRNINFGAIGAHNCTLLYLATTNAALNTNPIDIVDNYFSPTAECANNLVTQSGQFVGMVNLNTRNINFPITFEHNTIIGNWTDPCCDRPVTSGVAAGTSGPGQGGYSVLKIRTNSNLTVQYNYAYHVQGEFMLYAGSTQPPTNNYTFQYNFFQGIEARAPIGHAEFVSGGPTNALTWQYNVLAQDDGACACGDALINVNNTPPNNTVNTVLVDHNVLIANKVAGTSTVADATLMTGHFISQGTFQIDSATDVVGSPVVVTGQNWGNAVVLVSNLSGSGVGSTWTVDCGVPIGGTWCPRLPAYGGEAPYDTTGLDSGGALITSELTSGVANYTASAILDVDNAALGTATITSNWLDTTGTASIATGTRPPNRGFENSAGTCGSSTFQDNLSLIDGVTTYNSFAPDSGNACNTGALSAPVVTNASKSMPITQVANHAAVNTMSATNSPTAWAITSCSAACAGWFAIDSAGAVTLTATGAGAFDSGPYFLTHGTYTLGVTASNAGGTSSPGTDTVTITVPNESADLTTVYAGSAATSITDSFGNGWTILAGKVAANGVSDSTTSNVIQLAYANSLVWYENSSFAWFFKSSPTAAWTSGKAPIVFAVSGGQIIDPSGSAWKGYGIAYSEYGNGAAGFASIQRLFPRTTAIRFPLHYTSGVTPSQTAAFVNAATAAHVMVIIEDHDLSNDVLSGAALTAEVNWYNSFGAFYVHNPYVTYQTMNEPGINDSAQMQAIYNGLRSVGYNGIIFLEAGQGAGGIAGTFGSTTWVGSAVNVGWDLHCYNWQSNKSTNVTTIQNDQNSRVATYQAIQSSDGVMPVMSIEAGVSTNGTTPDAGGVQNVQATFTNSTLQGVVAWDWDFAVLNNLTTVNGCSPAACAVSTYGAQVQSLIP